MKTAFISGASRGIGRGIAYALAAEGYSLALTCEKNITMLSALADELHDTYGVSVYPYACDMGDASAVSAMAAQVLADFGPIDVVVNNAGISYVGLITDLSPEEWDRIVSVNLS